MSSAERKAGRFIKENREMLAEKIMESHSKIRDKYNIEWDEGMEGIYRKGARYHLAYLAESLMFSSPELLLSALRWGKVYMPAIGVSPDHIKMVLAAIRQAAEEAMPQGIRSRAVGYVDDALKQIDEFLTELPSFLDKGNFGSEGREYHNLLLENKRMEAGKLIMGLVKKGIRIEDIYVKIFQPVQYELGRLWQLGRISVAQEHYCTASTQLIMSQLYPYIFQSRKKGAVFIGACVSGELHEIGIRMVSDMLELDGWDTYYLGANMPPGSIAATIADKKAKAVGLSATMTFHVEKVEQQIRDIRNDKRCRDTKIFVGGYVFKLSRDLWKKVGADGFGQDLLDSVTGINKIAGL